MTADRVMLVVLFLYIVRHDATVKNIGMLVRPMSHLRFYRAILSRNFIAR